MGVAVAQTSRDSQTVLPIRCLRNQFSPTRGGLDHAQGQISMFMVKTEQTPNVPRKLERTRIFLHKCFPCFPSDNAPSQTDVMVIFLVKTIDSHRK